MAIYYSRMSTVSRSRGQSSVAAAAYRSGVCLTDERTGVVHDYSRRHGVISATMVMPDGAPAWATDLGNVWNQAERAERRSDARTARELLVALPAELTEPQAVTLAQQIGRDLAERYGLAILVAVHAPDRHGDERNVHAHLLMSTRAVSSEGFGAKVRLLDDRRTGPVEARAIRDRVAQRINEALIRAGHTGALDPRPLRVQAQEAADRGDLDGVVRLARLPQRHQGRTGSARARQGRESSTVRHNAGVHRENRATAAYGRFCVAALRRRLVRAAGHPGMSGTAAYLRGLTSIAAQQRQMAAEQLRAMRQVAAEFDRIRSSWAAHRAARTGRSLASDVWTQFAMPAPEPSISATAEPIPTPPPPVPVVHEQITEPRTRAGLNKRQWAEYRRSVRAAEAQGQSVTPATSPPAPGRSRRP